MREALEGWEHALEQLPDHEQGPCRASCWHNLGVAWSLWGSQGELQGWAKAVTAYRSLLSLPLRAEQQASAHNSLGVALTRWGSNSGSGEHLRQALEEHRAALELLAPGEGLHRALVWNNLGGVWLALAALNRQAAEPLQEAARSFRSALAERPGGAIHATLQHNLGSALVRHGEEHDDLGSLEEGIAALRAAAAEPGVADAARAAIDNSLMVALTALAQREEAIQDGESHALLEEAVGLGRAALERLGNDQAGGLVARDGDEVLRLLRNFSAALVLRGRHSGQIRDLEEAVLLLETAPVPEAGYRDLQAWLGSQLNLVSALVLLAQEQPDDAYARRALEALDRMERLLGASPAEQGVVARLRKALDEARAGLEKPLR